MSGLSPRRLALVTGASSGIGAAIARELATRGSDLLVVARSRAAMEALAAEAATEVTVVVADLADPSDLALVERLVETCRPDVLVNAAGTGRHGGLHEQSADELDATVAVNVLAPLRLTAAAIRSGVAGVINISSTAAVAEVPLLAPYAASKAFLESWSLSVSARRAGGPPVPRVTVVRPGFTRTAFHERLGEDVSAVPDHAWLDPVDVARRALDAHAAGYRRVTLEPRSTVVKRARRSLRRLLTALAAGRSDRR